MLHSKQLEELQGQKLGAGKNPMLVSVRSGAKFSMPGMSDTILNLGLNDKAVEALACSHRQSAFCLRFGVFFLSLCSATWCLIRPK